MLQIDDNEVASHHTCYFRMLTKEYQGFNLYQLERQRRFNAFCSDKVNMYFSSNI